MTSIESAPLTIHPFFCSESDGPLGAARLMASHTLKEVLVLNRELSVLGRYVLEKERIAFHPLTSTDFAQN